MSKNIKTILLVASVALNVAFAVTYATYKLAGTQQAAPSGPLYRQLDLTPEQVARFEAERDKLHARLQELGEEISTRQIELIDLLNRTPPDPKAIEKEQEEIHRLQGAVQGLVIAHFLQASAFLTAEQRARFFDLIKARIATSVQACPPWMRSFEQGSPGEK